MPLNNQPGGKEVIAAAMDWHFSPDIGSPFWLARARTLDFNPRGCADLRRSRAIHGGFVGEVSAGVEVFESTFATVRHGTKITRGPGSRAAGLTMAFKLIEEPKPAGAVNAPHLVVLIRVDVV